MKHFCKSILVLACVLMTGGVSGVVKKLVTSGAGFPGSASAGYGFIVLGDESVLNDLVTRAKAMGIVASTTAVDRTKDGVALRHFEEWKHVSPTESAGYEADGPLLDKVVVTNETVEPMRAYAKSGSTVLALADRITFIDLVAQRAMQLVSLPQVAADSDIPLVGIKRTYQPRRFARETYYGFRARMATLGGLKDLAASRSIEDRTGLPRANEIAVASSMNFEDFGQKAAIAEKLFSDDAFWDKLDAGKTFDLNVIPVSLEDAKIMNKRDIVNITEYDAANSGEFGLFTYKGEDFFGAATGEGYDSAKFSQPVQALLSSALASGKTD